MAILLIKKIFTIYQVRIRVALMTSRHYLSRAQSSRRYAMEEVTLTQEQLEALTEGGHHYAYLTGGGGDEGEGEAVVVGASADELGVVGEPQQILLNQAAEGQEVFVLDQGRMESVPLKEHLNSACGLGRYVPIS